jgi:hypothetical protein
VLVLARSQHNNHWGSGGGGWDLTPCIEASHLELGLDPSKIMLKIDFKNAFDMITRDVIFKGEIRKHLS